MSIGDLLVNNYQGINVLIRLDNEQTLEGIVAGRTDGIINFVCWDNISKIDENTIMTFTVVPTNPS